MRISLAPLICLLLSLALVPLAAAQGPEQIVDLSRPVLVVPKLDTVRGWVNDALKQEVWIFPTENYFESAIQTGKLSAVQEKAVRAASRKQWEPSMGDRLKGLDGSGCVYVPVSSELKASLPAAFVSHAALRNTFQEAVAVPFLVFPNVRSAATTLSAVIKQDGLDRIRTWEGPSGAFHVPITPEFLKYALNPDKLPEFLARTLQKQYESPMLKLKAGVAVPAFVSSEAGNFQACDGPNCFYTVLRTLDNKLQPRHINKEEMEATLKAKFSEVTRPQKGDIILFVDPQTNIPVHAAIYLTEAGDSYIVFEKNSMSHIDPSIVTARPRLSPNIYGNPVCLRFYRASAP